MGTNSHRLAMATRSQFPAGWVAHGSASPRPANSPYFPLADDPSADRFTSNGKDVGVIAVAATKVATGLSLKAWSRDTPKRVQLSLGFKPSSPTAGRVGGEAAAIFVIAPRGGHGYAGIGYAVVHHGCGYDVQLISLPAYLARDRAIFERLLKSFRFTR